VTVMVWTGTGLTTDVVVGTLVVELTTDVEAIANVEVPGTDSDDMELWVPVISLPPIILPFMFGLPMPFLR
jgi:hypothetical protein